MRRKSQKYIKQSACSELQKFACESFEQKYHLNDLPEENLFCWFFPKKQQAATAITLQPGRIMNRSKRVGITQIQIQFDEIVNA